LRLGPEGKLKGRLTETAPDARRPNEGEIAHISSLIEEHIQYAASPRAQAMFGRLSETLSSFWVIAVSGRERIPLSDETRPASTRIV